MSRQVIAFRRSAHPTVSLGCLLALALFATQMPAGAPPLAAHGFTEHVSSEQRLVPLTLLPGSGKHHGPGSCAERVDPVEAFVVRHRGEPVGEVVALERIRPPAVHALLMDTSLSMLMADRLRVTRAFADAYVEQLPEGDRLGILRFSELVEMTSPGFTQDRAQLARAVDSIPLGMGTRIWDSIDLIFRELSVQPEPQKVLVVVSDADDTLSWRSRDELSRLLDRHTDIQVFLIGLPRAPFGQSLDPSAFDRMRTRHANVDFEILDEGRTNSVSTLIYRVQAWLDRHAIATVRLNPEFHDSNAFRIDLHAPYLDSCRVTHRDISLERAESSSPPALLDDESFREALEQKHAGTAVPPPPGWAVALSEQIPRSLTREQRIKLRRQHAVLKLCGTRFVAERGTIPPWAIDALQRLEVERLSDDRGLLHGCLMHQAYPTGRQWNPATPWGPAAFGQLGPSVLEMRRFAIDVPLDPFVNDDASVVLDRLALLTETTELHARLMEGESLLRQWPIVIAALAQFPELREHLMQRHRATVDAQIEELLDESRRRLGLSTLNDEARAALLAAPRARSLLARRESPPASDAKLHLAGWLGDVPAQELFLKWEERLVHRYLRDVVQGGHRDAVEFVAQTHASWSRLAAEFAPNSRQSLAPLVLLRQTRPDRYGFIRIILPRLESMALRWHARKGELEWSRQPLIPESWPPVPYDLIPAMPLALLALDHQRQVDPELARHLREDHFDRPEIRYEANPDAGSPQHPYPRARITYRFGATHDAARTPTLDLTAEVATDQAGGWQILDFRWNRMADRDSAPGR